MKRIILFILDLPFTIIGLVPVVLSEPYSLTLNKNPYALVFKVRKLRGLFGVPKKTRAATIGHTILLGPRELKNDFEHEIIHVKQTEKYLVIYQPLYLYETLRHGYRKNRFEDEAYRLSNSVYEGEELIKGF